MAEKITVPTLGESVTEATVSKWLKSKGEKVSADEPLVELETDKVNVEKQKEVFLLSRIEKMKYREIAEMLGISVKAVEKRMHLALLEMEEKIGNV